jgi:hypothetical protein
MDAAERRHEVAVFFTAFGVAALVGVWWLGVALLNTWIRQRYDVSDPTLGSHMGSDATDFRYDLAWSILVTLPVFVLSIWHAVRHRYVALYVWVIGLLWLANSALFVVGARGCTSGSALMGPAPWFEGAALASAVLACVIGGGLVGYRVAGGTGATAVLALALAATTALIWFVQWDTCAGPSWQVSRSLDIFMTPILAAVALPLVWLGSLVGRPARPEARRGSGRRASR